jgi:hypothetical protein
MALWIRGAASGAISVQVGAGGGGGRDAGGGSGEGGGAALVRSARTATGSEDSAGGSVHAMRKLAKSANGMVKRTAPYPILRSAQDGNLDLRSQRFRAIRRDRATHTERRRRSILALSCNLGSSR